MSSLDCYLQFLWCIDINCPHVWLIFIIKLDKIYNSTMNLNFNWHDINNITKTYKSHDVISTSNSPLCAHIDIPCIKTERDCLQYILRSLSIIRCLSSLVL